MHVYSDNWHVANTECKHYHALLIVTKFATHMVQLMSDELYPIHRCLANVQSIPLNPPLVNLPTRLSQGNDNHVTPWLQPCDNLVGGLTVITNTNRPIQLLVHHYTATFLIPLSIPMPSVFLY